MTRRWAPHPLSDTCPLCDKPLSKPLFKRKGIWVHKACHLLEVGE